MAARFTWRRLWKQESGFSLIEVLAATVIMGTVLVGTALIIGATATNAGRAGEGVRLQQLVRAQIENIMQSPFKEDPLDYPLIQNIPEGVAITFTATDPGTSYTFPQPDGTTLTNVIQQITVTAREGVLDQRVSETSMTFYKIKMP